MPFDGTKVKDEVSEILLGAADIIERHGWCQRDAYRDGKHCAFGAIRRAAGRDPAESYPEATSSETQAMVRLVKSIGGGVVSIWNDRPGRTKKQVVAVLRRAAEMRLTRWNDAPGRTKEEVVAALRKAAEVEP